MQNNLNSDMIISNGMQKQTDDDSIWPDEEKAIEEYEVGNEKLKTYKTPQELIADLHNTK